jgi:hypothetical protein
VRIVLDSFRQKSNTVQVVSDEGIDAPLKTIYTGKSAKFPAYLVHYQIDRVPDEPPAIVLAETSYPPDSCKRRMELVRVARRLFAALEKEPSSTKIMCMSAGTRKFLPFRIPHRVSVSVRCIGVFFCVQVN